MDTFALSDLNNQAVKPLLDERRATRKRLAAFSLVEVTFSIGIVAFAFVTTLGLLPTGLTTFRRAMDASVGSQIAQQVINDVQQTDFDLLTTGNSNTVRYFDGQGQEVVPGNPSGLSSNERTRILYWVNTVVVSSTPMPASSVANANLATIKIQIANNPKNAPLSWNSASSSNPVIPITSYWTLVSRNR